MSLINEKSIEAHFKSDIELENEKKLIIDQIFWIENDINGLNGELEELEEKLYGIEEALGERK